MVQTKERKAYFEARNSKLPVVQGKMHNCFCVPTHTTAPSISSQSIKYTFPNVPQRFRWDLGQTAQTSVSIGLFIYRAKFVLDTLGYDLEELLSVLVLTRIEK